MPKLNPYVAGFVRAMRQQDRRPVWQWCEQHIVVDATSPFPGRWKSERSPWVRDVMDAWKVTKRTTIKCSAQSAKTQTAMGCACWAVAEDPGSAMWVMAAKDEAGDFFRDRVNPTFEGCLPVREAMVSREGMTQVFATMPFYFTGSNSPSKLQSKPIRYLFLDEIRNYPPGALALVLNRTNTFWNRRELLLSTPDTVDDDVDREYRLGDQRVWSVKCPSCGTVQPLAFEQLKWDTNETTKPGGRWRYDELAKTIRLECVSCEYRWTDTPANRRQIYRDGRFVVQNPDAPRDKASFHWNSLLPMWVSWSSVVEKYLQAVACIDNDPPEFEPLKKFYNETLGMSWEPALGTIVDFSFLDSRKRDYEFGDAWPEEVSRYMAADKQAKGGEHYWWAIRAFGKGGASRLIAYGRCTTYDDLERIRNEFGVPVKNAMIDSGYKATEVYHWCSRSKWKLFKGDTQASYSHTVQGPKGVPVSVRRLWALTSVDPHLGKRATSPSRHLPLYRFAGETTKDFLAECFNGMVGDWTIPASVGKDYIDQITAERRVSREDVRGKLHFEWRQIRPDNHLLDCELMILVAAVINNQMPAGVVRKPAVKSREAGESVLSDGPACSNHP